VDIKEQNLPTERAHFLELLLVNHFGTIAESAIEPASDIAGDTTYEELVCVGYQPHFKRLEAVVHLKQGNGYLGGLCTPGSPEFVRFFTSTDGGTSWVDRGTASFQAHDVPGSKPLEFAVSVDVDLHEECCWHEQLIDVRAILSWNVPPTGPDDQVVWGNAVDTKIQVEPVSSGSLADLLKCLRIKFDTEKVGQLVQLEQPVAFGLPQELEPVELAKQYAGAKVPPHRFMMGAVAKLLATPELLPEKLAAAELFPGLGLDLGDLIGPLLDPPGDTTFEALNCVGLNPNTSDLVGILSVRKATGYSGDLCTAGSYEYVAFWVDWGDGAGWSYVGTTSVQVHDLAGTPAEGLGYGVFLPFPAVVSHRKPCGDGPQTARIRAVLSWQAPPPPADPHWRPVWGNHVETTVLIPPGVPLDGHAPYIDTIGSMKTELIDTITGRASGAAVSAGFIASNSPFGGQVFFTGHIANPADVVGGGAPPMKFKIWISADDGATWNGVTTIFPIWTTELLNGVWQTPTKVTQAPDPDGFYTYYEDLTGSSLRYVAGNVLARWDTAGDSRWLVYMEARDAANNVLGVTAPQRIQLDNTHPTALVKITSGGGSCGDFRIGDTIDGSYLSTDNEVWRAVGFGVDPSSGGTLTFASTGTQPAVGQSGEWHLDTTGMTPCGYVLRMRATDATIVNSGYVGLEAEDATGFCLKE
jgi:hypothetical protein